eukprot:scaffold4287_cov129-Ochromonas_danica.AAC.1
MHETRSTDNMRSNKMLNQREKRQQRAKVSIVTVFSSRSPSPPTPHNIVANGFHGIHHKIKSGVRQEDPVLLSSEKAIR